MVIQWVSIIRSRMRFVSCWTLWTFPSQIETLFLYYNPELHGHRMHLPSPYMTLVLLYFNETGSQGERLHLLSLDPGTTVELICFNESGPGRVTTFIHHCCKAEIWESVSQMRSAPAKCVQHKQALLTEEKKGRFKKLFNLFISQRQGQRLERSVNSQLCVHWCFSLATVQCAISVLNQYVLRILHVLVLIKTNIIAQ